MEIFKSIQAYHPKNRKAWRNWLARNHQKEKAVWLIMYKKDSNAKSIKYDEAVEEALCFGWIDSVSYKRDEESRYQYFSPRKPKSNWSKLNRNRVESMIRQGLMTPAGQALVDLAKEKGTWESLEEIDNMSIPEDLQKQFSKNKKALKYFEAFPPSSKKMILGWIYLAKRPETRKKRIEETVKLAAKNIRVNQQPR
jgi:uncharacterized protein YdeI (YjbR/CyaY-like superfamily)